MNRHRYLVGTISMLLVALTLAALPSIASADCGQFLIVTRVRVRVNVIVRPRPYYPPPPPSIPNVNISQNAQINQTANVRPSVPPPPPPAISAYPAPSGWRDEVEVRGRSFKEPNQYAVVAWNGKEEILWLSTKQQSTAPGKGAALSILPLPGRPISVTQGKKNLFKNAKAAYYDKMDAGIRPPLIEATIGAHNIFVLEGTSVDDLLSEVKDYVTKKFDDQAEALIPGGAQDVLKRYIAGGFKYFAFDLIKSSDEADVKVPIQYRFESDCAYYPLYISRLGGTGNTSVEAVVFTKGGLAQSKAGSLPFDDFGASRSVPFSQAELSTLDADLGQFFGSDGCRGRMWTVEGKMDGFKGDIMAR